MFIRSILVAAIAAAISLGWYRLFAFSSTPGAQFSAPAVWPQKIAIPQFVAGPGNRAPLLLVFVHPRCSCTRATLEQLDSLLQSAHPAVRVALVVYTSKTLNAFPSASGRPTFESAALLHHPAQIVPDPDGSLARRFGAATSGEIVLYSASGHLLFQGGITPMRSQTGRNAGADALQLALSSGASQKRIASVFGCPIFLPAPAG